VTPALKKLLDAPPLGLRVQRDLDTLHITANLDRVTVATFPELFLALTFLFGGGWLGTVPSMWLLGSSTKLDLVLLLGGGLLGAVTGMGLFRSLHWLQRYATSGAITIRQHSITLGRRRMLFSEIVRVDLSAAPYVVLRDGRMLPLMHKTPRTTQRWLGRLILASIAAQGGSPGEVPAALRALREQD